MVEIIQREATKELNRVWKIEKSRVLNYNRSRSQAVLFRAISGLAGCGASSETLPTRIRPIEG